MAITWTAVPCDFDGATGLRGCYAADRGQYAAGGTGANGIITSPDADTWTAQSTPLGGIWNDIVRSVSLGLYIAGGYDGTNSILTSTDEASWVGQGDPFIDDFAQGVWSVACKEGGSPVVMVGSAGSGDIIATTTDGSVYTLHASPFSGGGVVYGLAYGAGRWVACGLDPSSVATVAHSDDDGATWTTDTCPFDVWAGYVYRDETNALWYLLGQDTGSGSVLAVSSDGINWSFLPTPFDAPGSSAQGYAVVVTDSTLIVGAKSFLIDNTIIESDDGGATWTTDTSPFDGPIFSGNQINGLFAGPGKVVALGNDASFTVSLATGSPSALPDPVLTHGEYRNTWRWIVTMLDASTIKTFLEKLATGVEIDYVLGDSSQVVMDVPSDHDEVNHLADELPGHGPTKHPRVSQNRRLLFGFRREEGAGMADPELQPPWRCRWSGVITIVQDQAGSDVAVTHVTAHDAWTWAKTLPVLNVDGSLLGADGFTYTGETGDFIAKDVIANAYAWIVANYPDPLPWNDLPNDGQHLLIDIDSGHFGTTEVIPTFEIPQGSSVADAWSQLVATGTVDILLEPVWGSPGVASILNVYSEAGKRRPNAIFGWGAFPRNLVGADALFDGTQLANYAQYYAGDGTPADPGVQATSVDAFGPYWLQKSFPSPANKDAVGLIALADAALRKNGKQTVVIDPAPEISADPFTQYYLGDEVSLVVGETTKGGGSSFRSRFKGGLNTKAHRVYGFKITLDDDQTETVTQLLLSDPNEAD